MINFDVLNAVDRNTFLSTLPGDGNGQTLVTLGPCGELATFLLIPFCVRLNDRYGWATR